MDAIFMGPNAPAQGRAGTMLAKHHDAPRRVPCSRLLDRLSEDPQQLLILRMRSDPEPHDGISFEKAYRAPVDVDANRVDG